MVQRVVEYVTSMKPVVEERNVPPSPVARHVLGPKGSEHESFHHLTSSTSHQLLTRPLKTVVARSFSACSASPR